MSIIGHRQILEFFEQSQKNGTLSHAYLFIGPQAVGKYTVARYLAKQMICHGQEQSGLFIEKEKNVQTPCDQCQSCKEFEKGTHPDLHLIQSLEDKHRIVIEQIRNLLKQVYRTPIFGRKKIVIIDQADQMTIGASNAFLKSLEEPPSAALIFLITHLPDKLPETIISRCQTFEFSTVSEVGDDKILAKACLGRPGLYKYWQEDQTSFQSHQQEIQVFFDFCRSGKGQRLKQLDGWFKKTSNHVDKKKEWKRRLNLWQLLLRDFLMVQLELPDLARHPVSSIKIDQSILPLIDRLRIIERGIDANINLRTSIEDFAVMF